MTIELNDYGFVFDTYVCYVALSWQFLAPVAVALIAYKIYKRKKNK
jgi:hypothetical protein